MENRLSSSAKYSQDSQHLASSNRFKNLWKNDSVIQSSSKGGSSSCQCSTTFFGEKKKIQRNVKVILTKLRSMLWDFLADIGHSRDLHQKRIGTELVLISLMEFGTKLLRKWWLNSQKPPIRYSVLPAPLKEENYEGKEEQEDYPFKRCWTKLRIDPAHRRVCESAQYLRSGGRHVQGGIQRYHGFRETRSTWSKWYFGNDGNSYRTSKSRPSDRWTATEKPVAWRRAAIRTTSDARKLSKLCSNAFLKLSKENNISSHLMQKDRAERYIHAVNVWCLVTIQDLEREAGFVRIRKLAQSWTFTFVIMKIVTVFKFRSDLCFKTERIVNGVEKYVNETTETIEDAEHKASGKHFAKARSRMWITNNADTSVSVPLRDRKWVEINPGSYNHVCYVKSKAMIRLLRHDQNIPRETDGAVKYEDIVEEFIKKENFQCASQWSLNDWISFLAKGGGAKKRFQYCMDLLNDKECIARLKKCCTKRVNRNMENTHPFLRDGSATTSTESRCQTLAGLELDIHHAIWQNCLGKSFIRRDKSWENSKLRTLDSKIESGWCSATVSQRPDFVQAKRECKRLHDECMARTQEEHRTIPRSQQVRQRRTRLCSRSSNRLVHKWRTQQLDDKKLEFLAFFTVWPSVKNFSDRTSFGGPGDQLPDNQPTTDGECTYSASQNAMHKYSHSPRNTRGSSRLPWCVKSSLLSQRHVSPVAALATEHFYTISLTVL